MKEGEQYLSLSRPIIRTPILPFPSDTVMTFEFDYVGQSQAIKNNLVIERVSNNSIVYNQTQETFSLRHILPENTLVNGTEYRARLRVGDINNNWSQFSDWVIFWVLSPPILNITNIDYDNQNRVYNQTVEFSATYTQSENELLQSYRYLLYDSNQNLITSFPEQFSDGSQPLTQVVTGLENGVTYYIEVTTISANGALGSSGKINFRPLYIAPRLSSVLTVENLTEQGAIKISANILQIIGKLYDQNDNEINPLDIEYIDDEWIDLTRPDYKKLVFTDGFDITQSNFVLKLWIKNIPENVVFLKLTSEYGAIELIKYNNRIHAYKSIDSLGIRSHFASQDFIDNIMIDDEHLIDSKSIIDSESDTSEFFNVLFGLSSELMLYLKQYEHLIDLEFKMID